MATANSTGARPRADHSGRIAPTFPQSPADKAAFASASYVRGDSDPNMDEALRRVRSHGAALREGMAAYREWAAEDVAA
jgi:hypothetical protein